MWAAGVGLVGSLSYDSVRQVSGQQALALLVLYVMTVQV